MYTILSAALAAALDSGRLVGNPAAHPPTAGEAQTPEMQAWTAAQLAAFLGWAERDCQAHAPAWQLLAHTGSGAGPKDASDGTGGVKSALR